eukprot:8378216-Pyramimonas_sp.AAC.1
MPQAERARPPRPQYLGTLGCYDASSKADRTPWRTFSRSSGLQGCFMRSELELLSRSISELR